MSRSRVPGLEDEWMPKYGMFLAEMQAIVESIQYDFRRRVGVVDVAAGGCTDMSGAIAFFTRIDPAVRRIETLSDYVPDTVYVRTDDTGDTWEALRYRRVGFGPSRVGPMEDAPSS
jgi:hypothetical protein